VYFAFHNTVNYDVTMTITSTVLPEYLNIISPSSLYSLSRLAQLM